MKLNYYLARYLILKIYKSSMFTFGTHDVRRKRNVFYDTHISNILINAYLQQRLS